MQPATIDSIVPLTVDITVELEGSAEFAIALDHLAHFVRIQRPSMAELDREQPATDPDAPERADSIAVEITD